MKREHIGARHKNIKAGEYLELKIQNKSSYQLKVTTDNTGEKLVIIIEDDVEVKLA